MRPRIPTTSTRPTATTMASTATGRAATGRTTRTMAEGEGADLTAWPEAATTSCRILPIATTTASTVRATTCSPNTTWPSPPPPDTPPTTPSSHPAPATLTRATTRTPTSPTTAVAVTTSSSSRGRGNGARLTVGCTPCRLSGAWVASSPHRSHASISRTTLQLQLRLLQRCRGRWGRHSSRGCKGTSNSGACSRRVWPCRETQTRIQCRETRTA
mmetsp:Transcript_44593/g.126041  ORF Transcript_44593/g.126041 Transcript_44593/m.126041 type:complete len:215 (-) Transcript_44593:1091-1735(-)